MNSGGGLKVVLAVGLCVACEQALRLRGDSWLAEWTDELAGGEESPDRQGFYVRGDGVG